MRIPEAAIQEVLRRASIVEVVGEYVNLTQKGDRYWGLSPFKPEKTPSFSVSPDRQAFYCFSTQKGGGTVQFIMEMEHLSFPEAIRFLARKYQVPIEVTEEVSAEYRQKTALEELVKRLGASLHHILLHSTQATRALDYARSRGLSDKSILDFQLGYMPAEPEWLYRFLIDKNYSPEILSLSGFFSKRFPRRSIFHDRLMFPIANLSRQPIAFGGRILQGEGPKYINSPETLIYKKSQNLFGLHLAKDAIKSSDSAIVCEGYLDVIALHQGGLPMAVAPLGTAFTREQGEILRRLASKLILLFDGDDAGIRATMKSLMLAESLEFDCSIVVLPDAKDPADILQRDSSQSLEYLLSYKVHAFEYILRRFMDRTRLQSPEGKELLVREFIPYLDSIPSSVKREAYVTMLADTVSIRPEHIRFDLERKGKPEKRPEKRPEPDTSQPKTSTYPRFEKEFKLMLAVFLHSGHFPFVRDNLQAEDFRDHRARDLFLALEESSRNPGEPFEAQADRIEDEAVRQLVLQKRLDDEFGDQSEAFVRQGVIRLRADVLEGRRLHVEQTLKRLQHLEHQDAQMIRELLEEKMILDQTLRDLKHNE